MTDFNYDDFYDVFPRVEEEFGRALDESLAPRGPDLLYDLVASLGLPADALVLDVGCGEGEHAVRLAERFGVSVVGIDPVPRHIELARANRSPRLRFELGSAEALPVDDASIDLVWCRDMLVHIARPETVFGEFRRVLRPGGRVLAYNTFATERLLAPEAEWLFGRMGVVPGGADAGCMESALAAAGLRVDECLELGSEWEEYAEERTHRASRLLLHAARLLRAPERYIAQYGRGPYEIKLGDCLWHVYQMLGKLSPRIYVLSVA